MGEAPVGSGPALAPAPLGLRMAAAVVRRLPWGRFHAAWRAARVWEGRPYAVRVPGAAGAGGATFHCDLRDAIAREVCFTGGYGHQETALLDALLRPGGTFVDVGANWGWFTLLAASRVGPAGRVVALEPDPRLFPLLAGNAARNALGHVLPLPVAASDREGEAELAGYEEGQGNRGLSSLVRSAAAEAGSAAGPVFRVRTARLDDLLEAHGVERVDLVKVDVEGAEEAVLRGMAEGIAARRYRAVLLELHPGLVDDAGGLFAAVRAALGGAGYRGWTVDHAPETTRRAVYGRALAPRGLLRPLEEAGADAWPHQLWTVPGGWEP